MSDGLNVCFRGLVPDEGVVSFARRLFHDAAGEKLRGKSCRVWLTRADDGLSVHANVTLACRTRAGSVTGAASARDPLRALVAAFAATETCAMPPLRALSARGSEARRCA